MGFAVVRLAIVWTFSVSKAGSEQGLLKLRVVLFLLVEAAHLKGLSVWKL